MSGLYTNGMSEMVIAPVSGALMPVDTNQAAGENPETASVSLFRLATMLSFLATTVDETPVNGTRFYRKYSVAFSTLMTGIAFKIGSVGGTDKVIVELHDSTGALVATSNTAGVTLGTAATWQEIPFYDNTNAVNLPYQASPGQYYIVVQLNGNTGRLAAINAPGLDLPVGSAAGTFGTGASITPPTTYTAGVGPMSQPY